MAAAGEGLVEIETTVIPTIGLTAGATSMSPSGSVRGWLSGPPGRDCRAEGGIDRDRDRSRAGLRHRRPRDDLDESGAAARACRDAPRARRDLRPRHRSRVLAIAAARLGFGPVSGFDHELPAIEAATANASLNGVEVGFQRLNLREQRSRRASLARQSDGAAAAHGCRADPDPGRAGPDDRQRHARRRAPAGHRGTSLHGATQWWLAVSGAIGRLCGSARPSLPRPPERGVYCAHDQRCSVL